MWKCPRPRARSVWEPSDDEQDVIDHVLEELDELDRTDFMYVYRDNFDGSFKGEIKKEDSKMSDERTLYEFVVVLRKTGEVLTHTFGVGSDRTKAIHNANISEVLDEDDIDIESVEIFSRAWGEFIIEKD